MTRSLAYCGLVGLLLFCGCGKAAKEGGAGGGTSATNSGEWKTFDPEQGKFSVLMPGTPEEARVKGGVTGKQWSAQADGLTYTIHYEVLNKSPSAEEAERLIDNEVDVLPFALNATKVGDDPKLVGGQSGRELAFELKDKTRLRLRICVAGGRMYSLEATGTKELVNSINANTFLDSLKLAP